MNMVRVLVVCQANMSRSQSLTHYLRALSHESGLQIEYRSAGIDRAEINDIYEGERYRGGDGKTPRNSRALIKGTYTKVVNGRRVTLPLKRKKWGKRTHRYAAEGTITPSPKVIGFMSEPQLLIPGKPPRLTPATLVNKRLIGWADLVLAADANIEGWLRTHFPAAQRKVRISTYYARGGKRGQHHFSRVPGDFGMKDAAWPRNKPNPPEFESGVLRGTPEAHRLMLARSKKIAEDTVAQWKERVPFQTPRERKKARKLAAHMRRGRK